MIFHEIYGCYYNAVAQIISYAIENGSINDDKIHELCNEYAFSESFIEIGNALKTQRWQLLDKNGKSLLKHKPAMPLSTMQKRWLKAISLDPKIKLFDIDITGLEDVKPLFTPNDYVLYDKYCDGDNYTNENYILNFRNAINAIKEKRKLYVVYKMEKQNKLKSVYCIPIKMEYSAKDDKFRLIATNSNHNNFIFKMSKVILCQIADLHNNTYKFKADKRRFRTFTMEITDERNALERVMLHFSHFEKKAECLDKNKYKMQIKYDANDESELVIRVLSFGPLVKVTEPEPFVKLIREKIIKQKELNNNTNKNRKNISVI